MTGAFPMDIEFSTGQRDTHCGIELSASAQHRNRGAGATAASQRLADAAFPDAQPQRGARKNLREADVAARWKRGRLLNLRPKHGDRRARDVLDLDHCMRIAHRYRADLDVAADDFDRVASVGFIDRVRTHGEWDRSGFECRLAHLGTHLTVRQQLHRDWAGGTFEPCHALAQYACACEPASDAAQAVATLAGTRAIGVPDRVCECAGRIARWFDGQQLIETHTEMAVAQQPNRVRIEREGLHTAINNHEVVTETLHLAEAKTHVGCRFSARRNQLSDVGGVCSGMTGTPCGGVSGAVAGLYNAPLLPHPASSGSAIKASKMTRTDGREDDMARSGGSSCRV